MSHRNSRNTSSPGRSSGGNSASSGHTGVRHVEIGDDAGQRIDNYLLKTLRGVPKSRVYRMLRTGEVRVNGGRKGPTYRLRDGDRVRLPPHRAGEPAAEPFIGDRLLEVLAEAIVYEDADLLAVNKPAGLAVHGGSGLAFGVVEALRRLKGPSLELAHRLDRDTSGCLLLVKRRPALRRLHAIIREGRMEKIYRLIVAGTWSADLGSIRQPLKKYAAPSGERRVRVAADGKPSRTDFRVLARAGNLASLLEAQLLTGRTHQIRVHCQSAGHPLLGDEKYGSDESRALAETYGIRRRCLHAESLTIPWDDKELLIRCEPPDDFEAAWRALSA
jgi:23S rRNA pseudouridine955/2504/2580 synthase